MERKINTAHKKEIFDVVYLLALQSINYVFPLLVFPYLMVTLGAEKFGYIGFSMSVIQYLMLIVDFGFNLSATKRIALYKDDKEKLEQIVSSTLLAKLGLLLLSFFILLIFAFAIPRFAIYSSTMLVLFLMVVSNTFSFIWLFQGLGKIRTISFVNILSKLLILPLTFILVKGENDYLLAASIQSGVYVFGAIVTCGILYKKKYVSHWFKSTISHIKYELVASYPIFLSSAASSIYTASYAVILAYFSNPIEVGKYTAVEKIMRGFCYLILIPITQSFYPKVSSLSVTNSQEASKLTRKISIFVFGIMILVFILMFFFSPYLVDFLGKDYKGSLTIFRIMSVIPIFISLGGIFGQLGILAMGTDTDKKYFQRTYFIAGIVALSSIIVLAPHYQAIGAAISLFLTELAVLIGMFWYAKKYIFNT
jgi:O-antigen/teichoic acid export membrane protein